MTTSTQKENHTMRTTLGGAALVLTIAAVATGCGGSDTAPPSPSSRPAAPSTSATPTDPFDVGSAAGQSAIRRYFAATNAAAKNPMRVGQLEKVLTGTLLVANQNQFKQFVAQGWHNAGAGAVLTKMNTRSVDFDKHPATVVVDVCRDASAVHLVDKSGNAAGGSPVAVVTTQYTVTNYAKGHPAGRWRVATAVDKAVGSCAL